MVDPTSKPRVSDSELAGEIANLERLRLNPTGLSTREAYVLLALYELSNRRAFETAATPTRHQWVKTPRGWDCRGCGSFAASNSGRDFIDLDYPCRPALKASGVACCPHRIALDDECHECGAVNGEG